MQADIPHRAARRQQLEHGFIIIVTGVFQQLRRLQFTNTDDGHIHFGKFRHHRRDVRAVYQTAALLHGVLNTLRRQQPRRAA